MMEFRIGDTQRSKGTCSRSFQPAFSVGPHGKPFRMFFAIFRPHVRNAYNQMRGRENTSFLDLSDSAMSALIDLHRSAIGKCRVCRGKDKLADNFLRHPSDAKIPRYFSSDKRTRQP